MYSNTIYINPYPDSSLDIVSVEYSKVNTEGYFNFEDEGIFNTQENSNSVMLSFEKKPIEKIRINLRQKSSIDIDSSKKMFMMGLQNIAVYNTDYISQSSFYTILEPGTEVKMIKEILPIIENTTDPNSVNIDVFAEDLETNTLVPVNIGSNISTNYNEKFWDEVEKTASADNRATLTAKTKKLDFRVTLGMDFTLYNNDEKLEPKIEAIERNKYIGKKSTVHVAQGDQLTVYKYAAILSSLNHPKDKLTEAAEEQLDASVKKGFERMLHEQAEAWEKKWEDSDIVIEGDLAAQQGIRFNIFQLNQTYTGEDERLNIGPKGFTGEKYGGSTYWDTEAYCLPFYLRTSDPSVPRNLLLYRYKHLQKAIENAQNLGFTNGAALYPMVTMNGEESHNEWEITFEEIHRNGAIAYAIFNYIRYTGDEQYLFDYGLEVLISISRFWRQRVNFSEPKQKYVMLGVTGPNEYENNVHNNWYTNLIASWTMEYTMYAIDKVSREAPEKYQRLVDKLGFNDITETNQWREIIENLYFPYDANRGVYLQQEGYLDKEQMTIHDLQPGERPLNQTWSWDRILRSCFIKQADVLQGLYFLEDNYNLETIRRNFDFYEPRTVHESSLSPCVHAILASKLGYTEKAYNLYLRTARLDLDDYNNEVAEGCHVTSMAGTYMTIVEGFGGMRIQNGQLHFNPFIPEQWNLYSFIIKFRGRQIKLEVDKQGARIYNQAGKPITLFLFGQQFELGEQDQISANHPA